MKIFETDVDLQREKKAIERFVSMSGFKYKKLDQFDIDYRLLDDSNNIVGYAEVKGRIRIIRDAYPLPISAAKAVKLLDKRMDCWIIWACEDGIIYGNPKELYGDVKWGGRPQREGTYNDQELMLYFDRQKGLRYLRY